MTANSTQCTDGERRCAGCVPAIETAHRSRLQCTALGLDMYSWPVSKLEACLLLLHSLLHLCTQSATNPSKSQISAMSPQKDKNASQRRASEVSAHESDRMEEQEPPVMLRKPCVVSWSKRRPMLEDAVQYWTRNSHTPTEKMSAILLMKSFSHSLTSPVLSMTASLQPSLVVP